MAVTPALSPAAQAAVDLVDEYTPHNYAPLPIVIARGEGAYVWDVDGKRYLDCMAALSSVNFGHGFPAFTQAAIEQLGRVTIATRATNSDVLGPFAKALTALAGKDMVLPMNTGAEANETAIKVARKWAYRVKGVPEGQAKIIGMRGNFHGRTTTMVSLSDDPLARDGFAPFTPGFELVDYGDADAAAAAIDEHTAAVIVEPIQGEAGIRIPPAGYLQRLRELTREANVLLIFDEVQTGMGRTGETFRFQGEGVEPDLITVGKTLGGGIVPVSGVIGNREIFEVLEPGNHGSTFGGNHFAAAIGKAVCDELATGTWQARARELGARLEAGIRPLLDAGATDVRAAGLWVGVDIDPAYGTGKDIALDLLERGLLVKDTHGITLRFAPPFVVTEDEIDWIVAQFSEVLAARRP